jgi:hypothetical protein
MGTVNMLALLLARSNEPRREDRRLEVDPSVWHVCGVSRRGKGNWVFVSRADVRPGDLVRCRRTHRGGSRVRHIAEHLERMLVFVDRADI